MTNGEIFATAIGVLALIISFISLWSTNLSPFTLRVFHNTPTLFMYTITPEVSGDEDNKTWWIPSIDMGMSFYNTGAVSGELLDIRIVAYIKRKGNGKVLRHTFYPLFIVDYAKYSPLRPSRFKWIEEAVIRDWNPILLAGKSETHIHVVLENFRWDEQIVGHCLLRLEVLTEKEKKWKLLRKYKMYIPKEIYNSQSSFSPADEVQAQFRD